MTKPTLTIAVLATLVLAGCVNKTTDRGTGDAEAPMLPNSLDMDLHEHVVSITMPEGEPTAIVLLNITQDMWVRPFMYPETMNPVRRTDYWILCPWLRTEGLPEGTMYAVIPFWQTDSLLEPAMGGLVLRRFGHSLNSEGIEDARQMCATRPDTIASHDMLPPHNADIRQESIWSDEPRDGTLVLIISPALQRDAGPRPTAWDLLVGIAVETCPDNDSRLCPPTSQVRAEPHRRAPAASWATCQQSDAEAAECGDFAVTEVGPTIDGVHTGRVAMRYESQLTTALRVATAALNGRGEQRVELQVAGGTHETSCFDPLFSIGRILVAGRGPANVTGTFTMLGPTLERLTEIIEVPIDIEEAGFSIQPVATNVIYYGGCP